MDSDWQEVRRHNSSQREEVIYPSRHVPRKMSLTPGIPVDLRNVLTYKYKVQQIQLPLTQDNQFGPIPNIATIAFDTQQELLWVGDIHVSS